MAPMGPPGFYPAATSYPSMALQPSMPTNGMLRAPTMIQQQVRATPSIVTTTPLPKFGQPSAVMNATPIQSMVPGGNIQSIAPGMMPGTPVPLRPF